MHDDVIQLLIKGQEEIRDDLKDLSEKVSDKLVKLEIEVAYTKGKQQGRAAIIGLITGFVTSVAVHIFGDGALTILHLKK